MRYKAVDSGGDLAPSLGGTEKIFADQDFRKNFIDFFLVIDQVSQIFSFFSQIFRIFLVLNIVYDPFLTKTRFLLCSYFRAHPTTLLLKILGGRMHGPSPTSNFGRAFPSSP